MYEYTKEALQRSKELRKNQTQQERHLWNSILKNHIFKFQRQKPIDNYILDFYCSKAKLAIELDGNHHKTEENYEYDQRRTGWLEKYGILVIRFSNDDIQNRFDNVCKIIDKTVKERIIELEKYSDI